MKIINCEQRSEDWFAARLGLWTASFFDKAITSTGKPSTSANAVNNRLVAETIIGYPDETFTSPAMERGKELESEALEFLNFTYGYDFGEVGFCDSELGYGASPDAISNKMKMGLELKCPLPHTHVQYLADGKLPTKYIAQVQGQMLVTGFNQWVFCSYHPEFPPLHVVVKKDEEFCKALESLLLKNCKAVKDKVEKIKGMM